MLLEYGTKTNPSLTKTLLGEIDITSKNLSTDICIRNRHSTPISSYFYYLLINLYQEMSPLMYAVKNDHPEAVRLLLDAGSDVNSHQFTGEGSNNNSVIHYAAEHGFRDVLKLLIDVPKAMVIQYQ